MARQPNLSFFLLWCQCARYLALSGNMWVIGLGRVEIVFFFWTLKCANKKKIGKLKSSFKYQKSDWNIDFFTIDNAKYQIMGYFAKTFKIPELLHRDYEQTRKVFQCKNLTKRGSFICVEIIGNLVHKYLNLLQNTCNRVIPINGVDNKTWTSIDFP